MSGSDVQLRTCNGSAAQKWQRTGEALVNTQTGKCLDAADGGTADGTKLIVRDWHGGANQRWATPA
ncbi:RICIN domain-containing protein [Streptomyces sp. NPDC059909]|uniref:RICIN domain-containing protein n=1 Tax=Streptomyces sp. NPDC059909 TaxID=3346998 RepID=UPI00364BAAD4